ncbi:MAG: prepilin peptidase, partial [Planctomycetaceae bacterium]|nr:prepilin peptidase [Planctomycetaceae bacterium]
MLTDPNLHKSVFLFAVVLFTAITAWTDTRWRRIPNKITLPMWIAGWLYQGLFFKLAGLLDGLYGFGIGFGLFFVLWMVGSAGGGDVKLMGALSVWLGPGLTLKVLLCSLIFVVLTTLLRSYWRLVMMESPSASAQRPKDRGDLGLERLG